MAQRAATETMSQRWARALDRALADGLDVLVEPVTRQTFVWSATDAGGLYQVSRAVCSWRGGRFGAPCKRCAALLAQLGELPVDAPPAREIVPVIAVDMQIAA